MKTFVLACGALVLAFQAEARDLGTMRGQWPAAGTDEVRIEFPAGEVTVVGGTGDQVVADLTVRCGRGDREECEERARRIRLITDLSDGSRKIKVDTPKVGHGIEIKLVVQVPARMSVDVTMGAGDLEVSRTEGDVALDLGAGEVDIRMPERRVRSVRVTVGVGDASLIRPAGSEHGSGFISRRLRWSEGPGDSQVKVHLGAGDVAVRLD